MSDCPTHGTPEVHPGGSRPYAFLPFHQRAVQLIRSLVLVTAAALVGCAAPSRDGDLPPQWVEPHTGMEFVRIAAGGFSMGLGQGPNDVRPAPVHPVSLSRTFYLGRFEVTQAQWQQVMGENPSQLRDCGPDCPVESVSWTDAMAFIERLSALDPGEQFRLPTEAEWELACRGGAEARYGDGSHTLRPERANYDSRIPFEGVTDTVFVGRTTAVGSYPPSPLGLYDMAGNVWEWTADEYCPYPDSAVTDPMARCGTDTIAIRGGSWYFSANAARCGRRYTHARSDSGFSLGLRIVREVTGTHR